MCLEELLVANVSGWGMGNDQVGVVLRRSFL